LRAVKLAGRFVAEKSGGKNRAGRDPSATIQRILAAAREEFGANGFDGTKVEHIAKRAGVSKQLVYLYFNGKDELYSELLKLTSRATYEALLKVEYEALEPETAIRTYIEMIYDRYQADPFLAIVTLDQSLHAGAQIRLAPEAKRMREILWNKLDAVLAQGKTAGVFDQGADIQSLEFMTVIIISGCVASRGMFARYVGHKIFDENPKFWRDYAVTFILRALQKQAER